MNVDALVWVYQYSYWDGLTQQHRTSTRYATRDAIVNGLGVPIPASGMKVRVVDVKKEFYDPQTRSSKAKW